MDESFTVDVPGGALTIDAAFVDAPPERVSEQAAEYVAGERTEFDVAVAFPDSFTGEVMRAMTEIPYGETRTYGELADRLGSSAIAVGGGCGRNPVPLVVPCHRVVGVDGLRGYSGDGGLDQKRALLEHEDAPITRQRTLTDRQNTLSTE